jgi:GT2 family glycosyltransferase
MSVDQTQPSENELVSLIIFGFNQSDLIETTIRAGFAQTYSPLEIILSDNCSDDDTFEVMQRLAQEYEGPHTIRLNRNSENRGFIGHVNQVFDLCQGAMIVYNPGDDVSLPERTAELYEAFRHDRPLLVHSDAYKMLEDGTTTKNIFSQKEALARLDLKGYARSRGLAIGAACAWHPDLMRLFGPIRYERTFDDLVFCYRARLLDRIAYVEKPLVYYRYGASLSKSTSKDPKAARAELRKVVIRMIDTYKQRLEDTRHAAPQETALIRELENCLEASDYQLSLLDDGISAIARAFTSWARFTAALSHFNKLRKMTSRRRIERQARRNEGLED